MYEAVALDGLYYYVLFLIPEVQNRRLFEFPNFGFTYGNYSHYYFP